MNLGTYFFNRYKGVGSALNLGISFFNRYKGVGSALNLGISFFNRYKGVGSLLRSKPKMPKGNPTQNNLNNHANQLNPNSAAYAAAQNNHANQM